MDASESVGGGSGGSKEFPDFAVPGGSGGGFDGGGGMAAEPLLAIGMNALAW